MHRIFVNDEHVPGEEYAALVRLLHENNIHYVERPRLIGSLFRFGASGAGADLMVKTEAEHDRARALIDAWQREWVENARADFKAKAGNNRSREIFGWIIAALVIGGVLALSLGIAWL